MRNKRLAVGTRGFSLIELMVVIGISAGISMAAYSVFNAQQSSYLRQQQIVEMQQSSRTFLYYIEKDLRAAGFDPTKQITPAPGFSTAKAYDVVFTADLGRPRGVAAKDCKDAGCDSIPDGAIISSACADCVAETIRYTLSRISTAPVPDANGQVAADKTTTVTKTFNYNAGSPLTGAENVVENIQALEFLYNLSDGTTATQVVGDTNLAMIRSVTVSLLVRSNNAVRGFRNKGTCPDGRAYFFPASNSAGDCSKKKWGPFTDNKMRSMVITNIQCRNMALQVEDY